MNNCNCNTHCREGHCPEPKCSCAVPVIHVEEMPEDIAVLRFNFDGVSTWYDYSNMIYKKQTDTSISIDSLKRTLKYMAERHIDTISAKELGSILHIADIGDVDITGATDNSIFVYQKNSDCGQGCAGIDNSWVAWNSSEHQVTSIDTLMGFESDGTPKSLQRPVDTTKNYLLGWAGAGKIKYITLTAFGSIAGKKALYIDTNTGEIGYSAS